MGQADPSAKAARLCKAALVGLSLGGCLLDSLSPGGCLLDRLSPGGCLLDGLSPGGCLLDGLSPGGCLLDGLSQEGYLLDGLSQGGCLLDGLSGGCFLDGLSPRRLPISFKLLTLHGLNQSCYLLVFRSCLLCSASKASLECKVCIEFSSSPLHTALAHKPTPDKLVVKSFLQIRITCCLVQWYMLNMTE